MPYDAIFTLRIFCITFVIFFLLTFDVIDTNVGRTTLLWKKSIKNMIKLNRLPEEILSSKMWVENWYLILFFHCSCAFQCYVVMKIFRLEVQVNF